MSRAVTRRLPFRTLVAYGVAAALFTVAWSRLEAGGVPLGDVVVVLALGLVPTLAVVLGARRLVVAGLTVLTVIAVAGVAVGISPLEARPGGGHDFFGPVLAETRNGLQSFYESLLPFDPVDYPAMESLVILAIAGFSVAVGMLAAAGRTMAAALVVLVGLGWAATLVPGERPLLTGAVTLGGMLLFLALARVEIRSWRSLVPAVAAGVLLVLAAVGASTSQAVAKGAFLGWEQWDLYDPKERPVSVSYVWGSRYGGLTWPEKRTTVLRIEQEGPRRQLYWRATTLDEYNGFNWLETQALEDPQPAEETIDVAADDPLLPAAASNPENWVQQNVEVEALRDNHLIGAAQPARWEPGTSLDFRRGPGGSIFLDGALRQGQSYSVWSYVPRPTPAELADAGTDYVALPGRYLQPLQGIDVPGFDVEGRDATMQGLFGQTDDTFLAEHLELYELTQRLTERAGTPYAAALVLEAWFRNPDAGGFVYDQQPPRPPSITTPLIAFVDPGGENLEGRRRGYCQHFAGAMTLMLRLLGIPSRIAAGFTSGTYDTSDQIWVVNDRNAHTWVEVYFPGFGWLPFDPTPGRGTLDAPYSFASTPGTSLSEKGPDLALALDAAGVAGLGPDGVADPSGRTGRELEVIGGAPRRDTGSAVGTGTTEDEGIDSSLLALVVLVLAGGAAAVILAKAVRRRIRFATRDPRAIASACRHDLVAFLRDQGADPPASATVSELGRLVEHGFAVDADLYVRSMCVARFGPAPEASAAARSARRELGRLRREMWRQLSWGQRIRSALSLRSLAG